MVGYEKTKKEDGNEKVKLKVSQSKLLTLFLNLFDNLLIWVLNLSHFVDYFASLHLLVLTDALPNFKFLLSY